jgi:hypothetical protein
MNGRIKKLVPGILTSNFDSAADQLIADPRKRVGHPVGEDGTVWFDDAADAFEESREEAVESA